MYHTFLLEHNEVHSGTDCARYVTLDHVVNKYNSMIVLTLAWHRLFTIGAGGLTDCNHGALAHRVIPLKGATSKCCLANAVLLTGAVAC
jgi:hypothetical protein